MSEPSGYRVVIADWALTATGERACDVLAVEHVRLDREHPCLVLSTTLNLWASDLTEIIAKHDAVCR